jgi:hypothetical protein
LKLSVFGPQKGRPNFFFTETLHQTGEDVCNFERYHFASVHGRQRSVSEKLQAWKICCTPHRWRRLTVPLTECTDRQGRTQNIVPCEKWQFEHCAA